MQRSQRLRAVVSSGALLLLVALTSAGKKVAHPEVDANIECRTCHVDVTPDVVAEWETGPHGQFNVKCFVCHGSVGADFERVPAMDRCVGCHADQLATMERPFFKDKTCFSCHPNHLLQPHLDVPPAGGVR